MKILLQIEVIFFLIICLSWVVVPTKYCRAESVADNQQAQSAMTSADKELRGSVQNYRDAAEKGNVDAQVMLGTLYHSGLGVPKDDAQSLVWFMKATDQGNAVAQLNVGKIYANGWGAPKDIIKAVKWYRNAAEQGNAEAQGQLRKMYIEGQFIPAIDAQAGKWWRKLVEQATAENQMFSQTRINAEQDDPKAEVKFGMLYLTGVGTPKDREKAAAWFGKAAAHGMAEAQCLTAAINAANTSWHVASDNSHAVEACLKAANEGYADAQMILAVYYDTGRGVLKNPVEAAVWWKKAAEQGCSDAQTALAYRYSTGDGVPKDKAQGLAWNIKAAQQGNQNAMFSLGMSLNLAKMTGEHIDVPGSMDSASLLHSATEHAADNERDFLPNLWASAANQAEAQREGSVAGGLLRRAMDKAGINLNNPYRSLNTTPPIDPSK